MDALFADFHFIRPAFLLGTPVVVLLTYLLLKRQVDEQSWTGVIDASLLAALMDNPGNHQSRRGTRWQIYAVAFSLLIGLISAAGPAWEKTELPAFKNDDALVIIADMSLSMHAQDLSPSRLMRMRYKILELLKQRKEGNTALIAYSGDAHLVSPLTDDANTVAALVPVLSPEIMPKIGSDAPKAFELAEQLLLETGNNQRAIVWFTDDVIPSQKRAIQQSVQKASSKLIIIGLGTRDGGPIPLPSGKFLKNPSNDLPVTARFDEASAQAFAAEVAGDYLRLQNDNSDISYINAQLANPLTASNDDDRVDPARIDKWNDQGVYLVPLLLVPLLYSFRRGVLLTLTPLLFLHVITGLYSSPLHAQHNDDSVAQETSPGLWQRLWQRSEQIGYQQFNEKNYKGAQQAFTSNAWLGAAHYSEGNYDQAEQHYSEWANTDELNNTATANAHYNRGHALAHQGKLNEALEAYDSALELNPYFDNAKAAREIVETLLQQQSENQQQQSPNQDDGDTQNNNQQNEQSQQNSSAQQSDQAQQGEGAEQQSSTADSDPTLQADDNSQTTEHQRTGEEDKGNEKNNSAQENKTVSDKEPSESSEEADGATFADAEQALSDQQHAELKKWLRNIENDPSGLLRRKFLYEQKLRERQGDIASPTEKAPLW